MSPSPDKKHSLSDELEFIARELESPTNDLKCCAATVREAAVLLALAPKGQYRVGEPEDEDGSSTVLHNGEPMTPEEIVAALSASALPSHEGDKEGIEADRAVMIRQYDGRNVVSLDDYRQLERLLAATDACRLVELRAAERAERELAEVKLHAEYEANRADGAIKEMVATQSTPSAIAPKWLETERRKIDQVACEIDEAMRSKIKSSDIREVLQSWWKRLDAISRALLRTTDGGTQA